MKLAKVTKVTESKTLSGMIWRQINYPRGASDPAIDARLARNPRRFQLSFIDTLFFDYFLGKAAMQLISTSEFPGSAATATVVRAGPPCGKYVLKTLFIPS